MKYFSQSCHHLDWHTKGDIHFVILLPIWIGTSRQTSLVSNMHNTNQLLCRNMHITNQLLVSNMHFTNKLLANMHITNQFLVSNMHITYQI